MCNVRKPIVIVAIVYSHNWNDLLQRRCEAEDKDCHYRNESQVPVIIIWNKESKQNIALNIFTKFSYFYTQL